MTEIVAKLTFLGAVKSVLVSGELYRVISHHRTHITDLTSQISVSVSESIMLSDDISGVIKAEPIQFHEGRNILIIIFLGIDTNVIPILSPETRIRTLLP